MRLSTVAIAITFVLAFIRIFFCGSIFDVGSGNLEEFHENFDLCTAIIGVIVGFGVLGIFLLKKERKSGSKHKNKLIVDRMNEVYNSRGKKIISEISISNKKRMPPPKEITGKVLEKSKNRCHFHPCPNVIINHQGQLKGHLIYIMTNEKDEPHYNPKLSDEEKMRENNLMLLCDEHYLDLKIHEKHTIETLMSKKVEAEEDPSYQSFEINDHMVDEIIQEYINRYPSD